MSVINPPLFLQQGSHSAKQFRRMVEAVSGSTGGVLSEGELLVSERAAGADMSVDVAEGRAFVVGSESVGQGVYFVESRGVESLAVSAADGALGRVDLVVARVQDSEESGVLDVWSLEVVTGTPDASPVAPASPANALVLAEVSVGAGVSSIVDADVSVTVGPGLRVYDTADFEDGSVLAAALADGAVTSAKIATGAVGSAALAAGSVGSSELAAGAVVSAGLAAGSVGSSELVADAVTELKLAADAVTAGKIATAAVSTVKIADGSVSGDALGVSTVTASDMTLGGFDFGEMVSFTPVFSGTVTWTVNSANYCRLKDMLFFSVHVTKVSGTLPAQLRMDWPGSITPTNKDEGAANVRGNWQAGGANSHLRWPLRGIRYFANKVEIMAMSNKDPAYLVNVDSTTPNVAFVSNGAEMVLSGFYRVST